MRFSDGTAALFAVLAAALYALNVPLAKLFLQQVQPVVMAGLLYLGAGIGMAAVSLTNRVFFRVPPREGLTKKELPYTVWMVVLDIAAPIFLMVGISRTPSAHVSLLNNFEIVATALIALLLFHETVSARLWLVIGTVTAASILLGFEGAESLTFCPGSLFVLAACLCWGFENNCTKRLSHKSATEIVVIKGLFSGAGSLLLALAAGERIPSPGTVGAVLLLGFVSYGLSIRFYVMAQNRLGAAKTSAYYSIAPFLGVLFSLVLLRERPGALFYPALALMLAAAVILVRDSAGGQTPPDAIS